MAGQGRLCRKFSHFRCLLQATRAGETGLQRFGSRLIGRFIAISLLLFGGTYSAIAADPSPAEIDVGLRLQWSSARSTRWSVDLQTESQSDPVRLYDVVNHDPSALSQGSAQLSDDPSGLQVQPRFSLLGGDLSLRIRGPADAKLTVRVSALGNRGTNASQTQTWTLQEIAAATGELRSDDEPDTTQTFDWALRRPAEDELQIDLQADRTSVAAPQDSAFFEAGESVDLSVQASSLLRLASRPLVLQTSLVQVPDGYTVWSHRSPLTIDEQGNSEPVFIEETIPAPPGVYELRCEVESDVDSIWNRIRRREPPLARRTQPIVVFASRGSAEPSVLTTSESTTPALTTQQSQKIDWEEVNWKEIGVIYPADSTWSMGQWLPQSPSQLIARGNESPDKLTTLKHGSTSVSMLSADQTFQATLPVDKPGRPHRVTVQFPGNQPLHLQVDVGPPGSSSGTDFSENPDTSSFVLLYPSSIGERDGWQTHSFICYPNKNDQIWLTNLANESTRFHSVTVEAGPSSLITEGRQAHAGRPAILKVDQTDWPLELDANVTNLDSRIFGTATRDAFKAWVASEQLTAEVIRTGMNGVMVPAPIVPTETVSMLMMHARPRGIAVWVNLPGQRLLPEIEQAIRQQPNQLRELTFANEGQAARYNLRLPLVQNALAAWIEATVNRYANHENFAGLTLNCNEPSHFALSSDPQATNRSTIETTHSDPSQIYSAITTRASATTVLLLGESTSSQEFAGSNLKPTKRLRYGSDQVLSDVDAMKRQLAGLATDSPSIHAVAITHESGRQSDQNRRSVYRHDLIADLSELIDRVDPQRLVIERDILVQQDNHALRQMLSGFASLPLRPMQRLNGSDPANPTVRVRTGHGDGHLYVMITSLVPWLSEIEFEAEGSINFETCGDVGESNEIVLETRGKGRTRVSIPGGRQVVLRATTPDESLRLRYWSSRVGGGVSTLDEIKRRVTRIVERLGALSRLNAYSALTNGGFEQTGEVGLIGWLHAQHPPGCVETDTQQPYQGKRSVRLTTDPSTANRTWIVSETIVPPASGRLAVSLAYRGAKSEQDRPHEIKVSLEGTSRGKPVRFSEVFEVPRNGQWNTRQVVLEADGIDAFRVETFRLTIDSLSPGQIWIDDVQLHNHFATEKERDDLQSLAFLAVQGLQRGNLAPSGRLLRNPWARHLLNLKDVPVAEPDTKTTTTTTTEREPGVAERLRNWLPRPLRF